MQGGKLELPDAGLYLQDGELVRLTDKGQMTCRYAIVDVMAVESAKVTDWAGIVTGFGMLGLAVVAKVYMDSAAWSWVVAIGLGFLAGVLFLVAKDTLLVLSTRDGRVELRLPGADDDIVSFVASLKAQVRKTHEAQGAA